MPLTSDERPIMTAVADTQDRIKTALDRAALAMTLRDTVGKGTAVTSVRLTDGLVCRVEEGEWQLTTDMSPKMGGEGTAPNPGVLGRAALGTCFATSFGMWAARTGLAFDAVNVTIEADYDARGELGVDDSIPPGYLWIRFTVDVESAAPAEEVRAVLELAERHTSWLDLMQRPVTTTVRTTVNGET
jgi:uncharacterized OsmC-like protein